MTDHDLPHPAADQPLHPLDELASAHLDGVGGPDAQAAEGLEAFTERFARMEQVRAVVQSPSTTPVDGERREAAIAAALAAFDVGAGTNRDEPADRAEPAASADTAVVPIAAARSRRFTSTRWRAVGIAAAVVAGAIAAVPLLTDDSSTSDGTLAAGLEESADDAATAADSATRSTSMGAPAGGSASDTDVGSTYAAPRLGDYTDYDALAEGVRTQVPPKTAAAPTVSDTLASSTTVAAGSPTTMAAVPQSGEGNASGTTTGGAATGCPPPAQGDVVYQGDATVEGHPVKVEVVDGPDGNRTMEVRDPDGNCDVVDSRPL